LLSVSKCVIFVLESNDNKNSSNKGVEKMRRKNMFVNNFESSDDIFSIYEQEDIQNLIEKVTKDTDEILTKDRKDFKSKEVMFVINDQDIM
jgi:hypothetical protein